MTKFIEALEEAENESTALYSQRGKSKCTTLTKNILANNRTNPEDPDEFNIDVSRPRRCEVMESKYSMENLQY